VNAQATAGTALAAAEAAEASHRVVLCMKWGIKYGPEYVNRLYGMVRRHLRGDFDFVCLTDSIDGIRAEVSCRPIPALALPDGSPERGWRKLTSFEENLFDLKGTALFLDLDLVIVADITPFFEQPGEFLIIHDWKRPWRITGNSSVYRFRLGAHADLLAKFRARKGSITARLRNQQAYLCEELHWQRKLGYWPEEWCRSYKHHCVAPWPSHYWQGPKIPHGTRIVVFQGGVNAVDSRVGRGSRVLRWVRPTPWIAEHWTE
jgi:hypothetical protein